MFPQRSLGAPQPPTVPGVRWPRSRVGGREGRGSPRSPPRSRLVRAPSLRAPAGTGPVPTRYQGHLVYGTWSPRREARARAQRDWVRDVTAALGRPRSSPRTSLLQAVLWACTPADALGRGGRCSSGLRQGALRTTRGPQVGVLSKPRGWEGKCADSGDEVRFPGAGLAGLPVSLTPRQASSSLWGLQSVLLGAPACACLCSLA